MQGTPPDQDTTTATTAVLPVNPAPATPLVTPSKRLPTALAFLCGCIALLMTGFGIIIPVFPQRLQVFGLGAETLALMEGAFGLGMFLFSTPMGTLADRIGRKPIVLLSLTGFVVTNLGLALVNIPLLFILMRFIEGTLISGLMPASTAMVGDSVPRDKQGRWIGMITTAQATGVALGPGIGGFLYQAWGFTSPFLLSAGIALTAALLALFLLPETLPAYIRDKAKLQKVRKQQKERRWNGDAPSIPRLVWFFAPLLLIDFGLAFIYPFVLPQYPFFFEKVLKYSAAQFGVIVSVYSLAVAVFPLFLGRLSEVLPKKLLIILGCLLYSVMNIGMLFLHQYLLLIAAAMVTGMGNALLLPALGAVYLSATAEQNRSQVMGVRGSAMSLGALLGALAQAVAGRWITQQMTFAIGFAVSLVMTLLACVVLKKAACEKDGEQIEP